MPGVGDRPERDLWGELEWRGAVHQTTDAGLGEKLAAECFTGYVGIDATGDSLHVGHLVGVVGLQRLQLAGHRPIALLGGATTLIGDPSFKASERPLLSRQQIHENVAGIARQLERFVDFGAERALLLNNADWLAAIPVTDFLRDVGKHFTVNSMITKEAVRARLEEREQGISFTEFSYILLQAYDFLHLFTSHGCRLQLGGSDQWGNITAGVDLIRRVHHAEAFGLTWPLITKADGTKFGKTESGTVWLDPARTSPYQFFQFWVRADDRDVGRYLRLLTHLPRERISELDGAVQERPEQREAQRVLAHEVTAAVHGPGEADAAARTAQALYAGDLRSLDEAALLDVFAEAPSSRLPRQALGSDGPSLVELVAQTGLAPSRSAARTGIEQGGVYVNDRRELDPQRRMGEEDLLAGAYVVLRKGKRSYHLVRFG